MTATPGRTEARVTVIVPTFNEAPNVAELVRRVGAVTQGLGVELLFVDDSSDGTPDVVRAVAPTADLPVRVIHRDEPVGGLGGAVLEGVRASTTPYFLVMDGDLQHPPELIPSLVKRVQEPDVDVVVASRYIGDGSSAGLSGVVRQAVSSTSTAVTRAMFPVRLRDCSDPMTGFFAVRKAAVDLDALRPRGFKILLEILARHPMRVVEVPFVFGSRFAGESKANLAQGVHFMWQLAGLRFGRMSRFAIIGGMGAVANIAIVALLTTLGAPWLLAALVAAELTIVGNFLLQERFVFRDLRHEGKGAWARFGQSFTFNNVETLIRMPIMALLVETMHVAAVLATAITIAVAFVVRFTFHSRVVYRPRESSRRAEMIEREAEQAGEAPAPRTESV
ncbi:glycosyltransferase [Cellulomonas dongxiuzhuiae]|uniref:Glycosyltransferase family 2 protein n=1 Tax=Cellulomonas dongxiuzhuiae TaxID=2819979 RepID=A0ABX8GN24_9CELL|nr:glycosyltransferase family 2 protein [Cellulomonas dongxiuzhuiae]MBO3087293.1 glycosyltransferase family 2 protein [Cellulomonas dongxiuzhuiae]MBO3093310.1 glycosyltransferase family 2 protein [Cellulomonas dongxiuzhuiae]QWC17594.1 glycosyltransferase family 2 protein [Cellulomonas dongxiuzhuiae]